MNIQLLAPTGNLPVRIERVPYWPLINAFLLPHLGSATVDTRNGMGFRALDNLDAYFAGRTPPDRVA